MAKILRLWLRMTYRCCGMEWTDEWPESLKLECPDCGALIEAHAIIEIGPRHASKARTANSPAVRRSPQPAGAKKPAASNHQRAKAAG